MPTVLTIQQRITKAAHDRLRADIAKVFAEARDLCSRQSSSLYLPNLKKVDPDKSNEIIDNVWANSVLDILAEKIFELNEDRYVDFYTDQFFKGKCDGGVTPAGNTIEL